jgi:hypothetical protein
MNFTAAAVASVPTETNLLLGVHLRSSTTQENGTRVRRMVREAKATRGTGDVQMHPSKFQRDGNRTSRRSACSPPIPEPNPQARSKPGHRGNLRQEKRRRPFLKRPTAA